MIPPSGVPGPKEPGWPRGATALDGRVVVIVSVEDPPPVMDVELKLQELSNGRPEHTAEFSGIVPLKPFTAVAVRVACPEPPGDAIVTVEGIKVRVKLPVPPLLTVTVTAGDAGEAP
jgi:hypothetical protein